MLFAFVAVINTVKIQDNHPLTTQTASFASPSSLLYGNAMITINLNIEMNQSIWHVVCIVMIAHRTPYKRTKSNQSEVGKRLLSAHPPFKLQHRAEECNRRERERTLTLGNQSVVSQ